MTLSCITLYVRSKYFATLNRWGHVIVRFSFLPLRSPTLRKNKKNLHFYFSSIFSGTLDALFVFNLVTVFCILYHAAGVALGQCYLGNIWCYYLACALETSRVAVNLHSAVNSLRACCSLEWLPLRRHLFAYEPCGNNSKSPHLLCKMNSVPLTCAPRADRLCLSCRFSPPAARGGLAKT